MKATAQAPSNIAFIKYWGKKDEKLRLPLNSSFSMNLSGLRTTTTVEFSPKYKKDQVIIDSRINSHQTNRVIEHLDRIRKRAKIEYFAKVVSENNFPQSTGLSSSASGFAALTLAGAKAAGLRLGEKELTVLSRLASGSSCRSIPEGFVLWKKGSSHKSSYAYSIFPPKYFDIIDIVVVLSDKKKETSSSEGQRRVSTSPFFERRTRNAENRLKKLIKSVEDRDFGKFGHLVEQDALEMYAVMLTSQPPLIYWHPESLRMINLVNMWKQEGLQSYFTFNTGQDMHIICKPGLLNKLKKRINRLEFVKKVIISSPSKGAKSISKHLF